MLTFDGYKATKTDEGVLVVHRVPIFCECERGETNYDGEWIAKAVAHAKQAERDGYFPPLHVRHHEGHPEYDRDVQAAGFFRIVEAAPITFKGSRRIAIFADLHITDRYIQEEVLRMRFPYRSVEIFDVNAPSIDGLALLDHEAPFLELPMLKVANRDVLEEGDKPVASGTFSRPWLMEGAREGEPVVACFRRGSRAALLFREAEKMEKEDNPKDDPKPDEKMAGEEGALNVDAIVKAIASGEISIKDMDAILAAIQEAEAGQEAEPDEDEPAAAQVPTAGAGEAMKKTEPEASEIVKKFAKLQGENEALRADVEAMKAQATREKDVAEALETLKGRPLGADLEERLTNFHKKYGAEAFREYVGSLAKATGVLPTDAEGAARFASQVPEVPEVALKWQDKGTDAVDKAAKFCKEWEILHRSGHIRMGQERYVEVNMARAAIKEEVV